MNLLIFGENLYDKSIYRKQLLSKKNELDYSLYFLEDIDYEKLSNEIGSFDMFQKEKNIVIRTLNKIKSLEDTKKLDQLISSYNNPKIILL